MAISKISGITHLNGKGPLAFFARGMAATPGPLEDSVMLPPPEGFLIGVLSLLGGSGVAGTSTWEALGSPCTGTGPVARSAFAVVLVV